ncbi:MAG: GNAT family N-acetyltransferase [Christensenellaceae bacterium]|nr:GNAT family N-acetyltransferase [Christensenellaceae bacterium]
MIRNFGTEDVQKGKALWETVFPEDKGTFADWFFDSVFDPLRAVGEFTEDGKLLSMLHMGDYPIRVRGTAFDGHFMQGVATRPEEQGKGYSSQLIRRCLRRLYEQRCEMTALVTFIGPYYEKFGFATYAEKKPVFIAKEKAAAAERYAKLAELSDEDLAAIMELYNKVNADKNGWVQRNEAYFKRYLTDCMDISGLTLFVVRREGRVAGYGLAYEKDGLFVAVEAVFENDAARAALECAPGESVPKVHLPDAMMRVLHVKRFVEKLHLPEGECVLGITDPVIEENTGSWHFFSQNGRVKATPTRADASVQLTIGEFSQLMMGRPIILSGIAETIEKIRTMFPAHPCLLFEQY